MSVNLNNYKTPIFPNINDIPVAPTASKAGNVADFIARVNGLIDKLQSTFNSLQSVGSSSANFMMTTPPSSDYEKIEIYYLNTSEHSLYTNAQVGFQFEDLIHIYSLGIDFNASDSIDISSLIQNNGIGYYFFLFRKADTTFKDDSYINAMTATPKGAVRRFDQDLQVVVYASDFNGTFAQRVKPLVVTAPVGTVSFTLADEQIVIG